MSVCAAVLGTEERLKADGRKAHGGAKDGDYEAKSEFFAPGLPDQGVLHAAEGSEQKAWGPEGDDAREDVPGRGAMVVAGGTGGVGGADEGNGGDAALRAGEGLGTADGGGRDGRRRAGSRDGDVGGTERRGHGKDRGGR